jgi:hypothetical protein
MSSCLFFIFSFCFFLFFDFCSFSATVSLFLKIPSFNFLSEFSFQCNKNCRALCPIKFNSSPSLEYTRQWILSLDKIHIKKKENRKQESKMITQHLPSMHC